MSIYVTTVAIADDDHAAHCAQWELIAGFNATYHLDDTRACTCQPGPLAYQGSHILPADTDPRGGHFDLGAIPGFITRDGRPPLSDLEDWPYHPWLRVSVNQETVVLTRAQVEQVHTELGRWLNHTGGDQ
jgi:hypothetical protein